MWLVSKIVRRPLPNGIRTALRCLKLLELDYGHIFTSRKCASIDKNGAPIPWYTYPAIEFLVQLDFTNNTVFEYGSGYSTLFWGGRSKKVISIEDNEEWYNKISENKSENINVELILDKDSYIKAIRNYDEKFSIIVIDGSYRYECAKEAVGKLEPGGMIILDNSDWFVRTAGLVRQANLIQIDMSGFGPINAYTWTTSFFLDREFAFKPIRGYQPLCSIGGMRKKVVE